MRNILNIDTDGNPFYYIPLASSLLNLKESDMTITKLKLAMLMVTALIVTFTSPLHSQENFQKIGSYEYAQFNGT